MSVASSIPRLCKSVKTFGRTPVSVPQVRGESCDIRLTRPYFLRTCHKQLLRNKPRNEIAIAFKFLHEGRLSFLTNLIVIIIIIIIHLYSVFSQWSKNASQKGNYNYKLPMTIKNKI